MTSNKQLVATWKCSASPQSHFFFFIIYDTRVCEDTKPVKEFWIIDNVYTGLDKIWRNEEQHSCGPKGGSTGAQYWCLLLHSSLLHQPVRSHEWSSGTWFYRIRAEKSSFVNEPIRQRSLKRMTSGTIKCTAATSWQPTQQIFNKAFSNFNLKSLWI